MISSEQVFDMLPHVVDIYEKLDMEQYRRKMVLKYKDKKDVDANKVGLEVTFYIVKNSSKVKEEFFSVVAIAEQKTVEEVKAQSLAKTIATFKNVFTDKELMDFFQNSYAVGFEETLRLLHSYYDLNFLLKQSPKHLSRLLIKASEKENETLIFDLWKTLYPKMMTGQIEFIEFSVFKGKLLTKTQQTTDKPYEEIEKEMDQVIAAYEGQVR